MVDDLPLTRAVLDALDQSVCVADARLPDMPLIYVNAAFEATTGYRAAEVLGRNCRFLQGPFVDQAGVDEIRAALRERRHGRVVLRNVRADGTTFHNELSLSPVLDADGALTHVVAVQRDVGELVEARRRGEQLQAGGLEVARELQRALLPPVLPVVAGLELAAGQRAGGLVGEPAHAVSGDFYDVLPRPSGGAVLALGDVAGRGAGAAAYTGQARWGLRALVGAGPGAADVVRALNASLVGQLGERFLTLALADVRPAADGPGLDVVLVLAGHPSALLRRADGSVDAVGEPGTLVGVLDDLDVPETRLRLAPGDLLLLHTDGVIEASGPAGMFGEARLREVVERPHDDAQEVVDRVLQAVADHAGDSAGDGGDDTTLLAVRAPAVGRAPAG